MSWNYRVIKKGGVYQIHEVYYNKKGKPYAVTKDPISLMGETKEQLFRDLLLQTLALHKDTLDYNKLVKEIRKNERYPGKKRKTK